MSSKVSQFEDKNLSQRFSTSTNTTHFLDNPDKTDKTPTINPTRNSVPLTDTTNTAPDASKARTALPAAPRMELKLYSNNKNIDKAQLE